MWSVVKLKKGVFVLLNPEGVEWWRFGLKSDAVDAADLLNDE